MDDSSIYRTSGTSWWAYTEHGTEVGVRIEGDHLLWYEQAVMDPHSGAWGASEQPFEDFLRRGPTQEFLSSAVPRELSAAVHARVRGGRR